MTPHLFSIFKIPGLRHTDKINVVSKIHCRVGRYTGISVLAGMIATMVRYLENIVSCGIKKHCTSLHYELHGTCLAFNK